MNSIIQKHHYLTLIGLKLSQNHFLPMKNEILLYLYKTQSTNMHIVEQHAALGKWNLKQSVKYTSDKFFSLKTKYKN